MNDRIYTVSEVNKLVKDTLEENPLLSNFFLKGEMSGVSYYKSGHLYFNLKDKKASVKCVAFNYRYKKISDDLKEGDLIKLFGKASLYEAGGQYQILVSHIEKEDKIGMLYQELENLKKEFLEKGYFDTKHKKTLPELPMNIGVVTSGTGAAVKDIINTAKLRYPNVNIYVYPAKVQGEGSVEEIVKGIEALNRLEYIDVIIAGRGGGSIEDLWSFNTREVAMAFYKSRKPIVSAVGHEIDFLLSDFVADVRASTPTHAAEIIVPEKKKLQNHIEDRGRMLTNLFGKNFERCRSELEKRRSSHSIRNFSSLVSEKGNMVLDREDALKKNYQNLLKFKKHQLEVREGKLASLNPMEVLKRGYTITMVNGEVIKSNKALSVGDRMETVFHDGKVESIVKEIGDEK
jgi:exodeoxyribonuclease VII large subunit